VRERIDHSRLDAFSLDHPLELTGRLVKIDRRIAVIERLIIIQS